MRKLIILMAALAAAGPSPVWAAEEWGIEHEEKARFEAKVVDVLCELSGDCPANCGGGERQLGLLRNDGKLVLAVKNADPFAGAAADLIDFCGKKIIADGLYIKNPKMPLFALQFKRLAPDGKWSRANWFLKGWAKKHKAKFGGETSNAWFRNDPTIKAILKKDGVYGISGLKPPKE